MSRDFRKLHVFQLADELLLRVYQAASTFPQVERYTLQAQLRRAALSASANIVEGSARRTTREYLNFINIAAGSATEARYLADVSRRLGYLTEKDAAELVSRYTELSAKLQALRHWLLSHEPLRPKTTMP
jgi:four helix bundle protein